MCAFPIPTPQFRAIPGRWCVFGGAHVGDTLEALCAGFVIFPRQPDPGSGETVREFHEPVHAGQVADVDRHDEFFDVGTGRDRRGVAVVIIAVGIGFIHDPDLTVADELGASPRRLGIGRLEDQFGARQRGQIGSPVLAIGFFKLVEGMHAKHEGTAKRARGLQAMIDRREAMQRMNLVNEKPRAQIAAPSHVEQRIDGKVHPEGQKRTIEDEVRVRGRNEKDRSFLDLGRHPVLDREAGFARRRFWQEAENIRIGDEGRTDRLCHFGSGG
ncbi:hypothetical protein NVSP9465_03731 [Novosphingobium sp. CECT 9465]|nr:hypothetical protein NVSP9465_03731 [Novosphingobium sp. CECT 9465]